MPTSADTQAFDRDLVTQIGLDSGALTRLGVIVHTEPEPGLYRGSVGRGDQPEGTLTVNVTKDCAVAQVNIDLAAIAGSGGGRGGDDDGCGCGGGKTESPRAEAARQFVVHPKGFMVFLVASGPGGYHVNLRKADEDRERAAYDTRRLRDGDIFAAMVLRPGRYSIVNDLSKARATLSVGYPVVGERAYRPPAPFEAQCGESFDPEAIELRSLQGLNLAIGSDARIRIVLEEPDDGPGGPVRRTGWTRARLPRE